MKHLFPFPIFLFFLTLTQAQTSRYFEFTTSCGHGNWQDTAFVAATSDQAVIDSVLANIERPIEERQFISGPIDYGNGGVNHNANHWFRWHFIPNEWNLVDFAVEVCDGCPFTDVDADTAYWVGNIGQFCPWSGKPVREVSLVSDVNDPGFEAGQPLFFPNPADDKITFNLMDRKSVSVQLFNTLGQELMQIPDAQYQQTLELAGLRQGVYFLKFTKGDKTYVQRLAVKRI